MTIMYYCEKSSSVSVICEKSSYGVVNKWAFISIAKKSIAGIAFVNKILLSEIVESQ